jgi:hypothetical protein
VHRLLSVIVLLLAALWHLPASAADPRIGVASATRNEVQGVRGGSARTLAAGGAVFSNERVRTGEASTAQLLFLDETSLSLGPKSEVTLDSFIYNPNRGTGNVVVSATQGAFRFVTGVQNPTNYTVRTPVASIGIRGTVIDLLVRGSEVIVILVEGECRIRAVNGEVMTLSKPGSFAVVRRTGMQGPLTWDGTIMDVAGDIPFPLYGTAFRGDPRRIGVPDDRLDLNDQLEALIPHVHEPVRQPVPTPTPSPVTGR